MIGSSIATYLGIMRVGLRFETGITPGGRDEKNCSSASAGAILISKFALWHAPAPRSDPDDCQPTTGKVDPESQRVERGLSRRVVIR